MGHWRRMIGVFAVVSVLLITARIALCGQPGTAPPAEQAAAKRGRISGIVTSGATGEPIAGAYVAVDHSGDAGGSNLERFRQQGIYVTAETDAEGRFLLEGVAFMDNHPLMVTHPGFVRHDQTIALKEDEPELSLRISLKRAATITVTAVDADGKRLQGKTAIRLEAKAGRVFRPMRDDWPVTSYRSEQTRDGRFCFGELDTGTYSIDVTQYAPGVITYHAGIADVSVAAGQTKNVQLGPAGHKSGLTVNVAKDPYATGPFGKSQPSWTALLTISRKPGLLLWASGRFYHPEDHRLGRVQFNALAMVPVSDSLRLANFPPGDYAMIAVTLGNYPNFKSASVYLRGVRVQVEDGSERTVAIPWRDPRGPAFGRPSTLIAFDTLVRLEARPYSVQELCDLLSGKTNSRAEFRADFSLQNEKATLGPAEVSIWELLEALYLEKGWRVQTDGTQRVVLRPAAEADQPTQPHAGAASSPSKRAATWCHATSFYFLWLLR